MYFVNSYITVAVYLALISVVFVAAAYWYRLRAAEGRLRRMMMPETHDDSLWHRHAGRNQCGENLATRHARSSNALPALSGYRPVRVLARRRGYRQQQFLSECLALQRGSLVAVGSSFP